jgi:5-(carboxyamino)imidazole ribonucleotide synthase
MKRLDWHGSRRLGILGGGQLGRMLAQAALPLDIEIHILDPDPLCSAAGVAHRFVCGDFRDPDVVKEFAKDVDGLTVEIENVAVEALAELRDQGLAVWPQPEVLALIRDKGLQKEHYARHGLATMPFDLYENAAEILQAVESQKRPLPFVQKTRTAGYDGQGVRVIRTVEDLSKVMDAPSMVEDLCEVKHEVAVIVARRPSGEIAVYDPIEMVFDPRANLIDHLVYPAALSQEICDQARELALKTAQSFGIAGLLAVELFVDQMGRVILNEVAPRPHNSGHQTIEGSVTSQYTQHLRAVFDLPLGSTAVAQPAVMVNILGDEKTSGMAYWKGIESALEIPGVSVHLYGKKQTRPYRKMGHLTVVASTMDQALENAEKARRLLSVEAR